VNVGMEQFMTYVQRHTRQSNAMQKSPTPMPASTISLTLRVIPV
jgi:hypothetical protein